MISRLFCVAALTVGVTTASAADVPANSPFGQAGTTATPTAKADTLQFAGVSTLGKKTMINLYDTRDKRSFWVEAGQTSEGVTVVSYDNAHDQVTVRVNGVERLLPLRPPSAVVSGPATPVPVMTPVQPVETTPPMSASPVASASSAATATPTATTSLSRARQEEEARMLVSDLLEIGMAQRKAYEEAKRKQAEQASGQQPVPPAADMAAQPAPIDQGSSQPAAASPAQTTPTGS